MAMPWTSSSDSYGGRCLKHPDRRPSPGVCSLCLKERLARLSNCKPSCSSSASLSLSNSHHSSPSTSSSYLDYSSSSPSTPSRPLPPSSTAAAQPRTRMSYLISKESRFTERSGRLWPLRRSSSAAFEVKRSSLEKKQTKATSGDGGGSNGLWSLLLLKRKKVAEEEKARGRSSWRSVHPKTVKGIIPLGVL